MITAVRITLALAIVVAMFTVSAEDWQDFHDMGQVDCDVLKPAVSLIGNKVFLQLDTEHIGFKAAMEMIFPNCFRESHVSKDEQSVDITNPGTKKVGECVVTTYPSAERLNLIRLEFSNDSLADDQFSFSVIGDKDGDIAVAFENSNRGTTKFNYIPTNNRQDIRVVIKHYATSDSPTALKGVALIQHDSKARGLFHARLYC